MLTGTYSFLGFLNSYPKQHSKWLRHLHCQQTSFATCTCLERKQMGRHYEVLGKQCSMFNLSSVGPVLWSRPFLLLPGICCALASVCAQGHPGIQSGFTATELSVSLCELMLCVRCQVELFGPRKEDSIICESPGRCHTTSLAARRAGTGRFLKWYDSLVVEVTARGNVVCFSKGCVCFVVGECFMLGCVSKCASIEFVVHWKREGKVFGLQPLRPCFVRVFPFVNL